MADITLDDLKQKQEAMAARVAALAEETDPDRLQEAAVELQAEGEELGRLAKAFEAQELGHTDGARRGHTRVMLTPAQQKRIEDETGIKMESLEMRDDTGVITHSMPGTAPGIIEHRALEEARRRKAGVEADEQMRAKLAEVFAAIEGASPDAAAKLDELKADPEFLGGVLHKK